MPRPKLRIRPEYIHLAIVTVRGAFAKMGCRTTRIDWTQPGCRILFDFYKRKDHELIIRITIEKATCDIGGFWQIHAGYCFIAPCLSEARLQRKAEAVARRIIRKFPELLMEGL